MKARRTISAKALLAIIRRRVFETFGSGRYSQPGLNGLDARVAAYLPRKGFFVEAGANDGFRQSNTYFLERVRGWSGLLVEGIPELYERCRQTRPGSQVVHAALVASDYERKSILMHYADLMSLVRGAMRSTESDRLHIDRALEVQTSVEPYEVEVPARTLSSILDEIGAPEVDFMSLDVEGYEAQVLRGIDLVRHGPRFILVEARFPKDIDAILLPRYEKVAFLSHHDVLYRRADVIARSSKVS